MAMVGMAGTAVGIGIAVLKEKADRRLLKREAEEELARLDEEERLAELGESSDETRETDQPNRDTG